MQNSVLCTHVLTISATKLNCSSVPLLFKSNKSYHFCLLGSLEAIPTTRQLVGWAWGSPKVNSWKVCLLFEGGRAPSSVYLWNHSRCDLIVCMSTTGTSHIRNNKACVSGEKCIPRCSQNELRAWIGVRLPEHGHKLQFTPLVCFYRAVTYTHVQQTERCHPCDNYLISCICKGCVDSPDSWYCCWSICYACHVRSSWVHETQLLQMQ